MMMMYPRWLERALVITCMAAPFCSAASGPKRDGAIVAVGTLSNEPISESVHEMDGSQVNRVDKDEENTNIAAAIGKFVATDEWQVIAEGQEIPPGLHVEIDMQSGVKRAKLMDEKIGQQTSSEKRKAKVEALTEAIQEVNDDGSLGSSASPSERLNLFIRKLSENKLNGMKVRQDTEVMTALIGILQDDSDHSDSQIVEVLEQLEGFVHQVDNAVDLHAMGGAEVVKAYIASTQHSTEVRAAAAKVVGSGCQNNPKAQTLALKEGMLLRLLDQLSESSDRIETKRTMFAVSALCRQHPEGLSEFVAHRGFETLKHIMWSTTLDVQASIVRFIGDIAGEHSGDAYTSDDTHGDNYDDHTYNPKLLRTLANNGWCNLVALLFEKVDQRPSLQEDVLNTLLVLNPVCAPETIKIRHHLTHTAKTLMGLYEADRENEYAKEIANLATRTVAEAEYIANQTTLQ